MAGAAHARVRLRGAASEAARAAAPQRARPVWHRQYRRQAVSVHVAGQFAGHRRTGCAAGPRPPHLCAPAADALGRTSLCPARGRPARHRALRLKQRANACGHHQQGPVALPVLCHHRGRHAHRLPGHGADRLSTCETITMSQDQHGDLSAFSMLDLFRMEADSQTQILTDGLLAMERHAGDAAAVESMMRAAHSIKGAAAIVGLQVVVQLAHGMEDSFVAAQHGKLKLTPERVDVLLSGVDLIVQLSRLDDASAESWLSANAAQIDSVLNAIAGIAELPELPALPSIATAAAPASALPAGIQEALSDVPAVDEAPSAAPRTAAGNAAKAPAQNFDRLLSLASESRINAHQMHPFIGALQRFKRNQSSLFSAIEQLHEAISRSGDAGLMEKSLLALQKTQPLKQFMLEHIADIESYERRLLAVSQGMVDEVLTMRMRPFRDGVQHFPRMVRDLARSLGKDVQLHIVGEDTLVDRDILAKIESPINHMLRNAIDHGMEGPYERIDAGKEALGTIRMEARHRAGMLSIEISDDGRGVDPEKIRQSVIERKMASPAMAAALSPGELLEFLFLPAFSLKATANQLSGRGVGLDIVHETIRQQNGTVRLESEPGRGFRALITLPLTQ